jgi:LPS-assembly protein
MFKFIYIFTLFCIALVAKDKVEIYATSMNSENNIVKAQGEVTVIYKDYFLTANEALYDRDSGELKLFGNVRANYNNQYKILGKSAKLNIKNKDKAFEPFYLLEKKSQVWISASKCSAKSEIMSISSGTLSGCDPNNPLWTMDFSSSKYNEKTQWLDIYNARLYIYDIPVFYTPYFGYPLDKTRRTGLLLPKLGFSNEEGFYYEQPIYIAEDNWWDLELNPQVRTTRGEGIYTTYRFVDSKYSNGEFSTGYFKESSKYFQENNLLNETHYGFNFEYTNNNVINQWFDLNFKAQSGLYIDLTNMNDVDYINLSTSDYSDNLTASQILSRINIFYSSDYNYYAGYLKYYKDLSLNSNDNTLQKLPTLHYHRYIDTFLNQHFTYNLDIKTNNIYRKINTKVTQTDIDLPLTLQSSFFDEFLHFSYTSYFYTQHSTFTSSPEIITTDEYENGFYIQQHNILSASTQLTRAYDSFTHIIGLNTDYTFNATSSETGFYDYNKDFCSLSSNQDDTRCEFYNIKSLEENIKFTLSQYFFDYKSNQILSHRLSQVLLLNKDGDKRYEDLENEIDWYITPNIDFYNNLLYNYNERRFSQIYNRITIKNDDTDFSISYLHKDNITTDNDNYMTMSLIYNYDSHYSYIAKYDYDFESSLQKNAEIGFLYSKRCWEFGLKYVESNQPFLNTNSISTSSEDKYIYFTIIFKPFIKSGSKPIFMHKLSQSNSL